MQFTLTTDYSIRVLLYLAQAGGGRAVPCEEIAKAAALSANYLRKVTTDLRTAGLIRSSRGKLGGFQLCGRAEDITLLDIVTATEDSIKLNRCLRDHGLCSRNAAPDCKVHQWLEGLQDTLEERLRSITLAQLV